MFTFGKYLGKGMNPLIPPSYGLNRTTTVLGMSSRCNGECDGLRIVISEFVLQSRYYVHFRANTLGKGMNPLILQLWLNRTTTVLGMSSRCNGECDGLRIVISEFVLQSRYYVHFRANTLGKGMNPLILPAMG